MKPDKSYSVQALPAIEKTIRKNLTPDLKRIFDKKVENLAADPSWPSLNTKPLHVSEQSLKQLGVDEVYEFRINMSYRCVFYLIHAEKLMILAYVGNHEQVARKYK